MRRIIFLSAFFISTFAFAQETSSIRGVLMDVEPNNEPLKYAKVSIKEIGKETYADENGVFKFENLTEGTYTFEYSFVGYETQEAKTKISNDKKTHITIFLSASTVSFDDILLTLDRADKKGVRPTNSN